MKPSVFLSTVVCGTLALPAIASAQDQVWLKDRRYTEGPGYQVGDFELHPGAALEFGYDSNYFRRAENNDPLGSLRLRLTPSLSFSTAGSPQRRTVPSTTPPSFEFKGGVSLTYNEFIPVMGTSPERASISSQRNLGGNLDLSLGILPGRQWSGLITGGVARVLTAGEQGGNTSFGSENTFNRDVPRAGAEVIWTPGAGLFEWRLGYQFTGTFFESLSQLSNIQNQIETRGRWRFLPRTSLVYDARFGFIDYTSPDSVTQGGKTGSHPMRALIGVNGLVTSSFSVLAMVGWGASFYTGGNPQTDPNENFDSAIGQLELKWYLTPNPAVVPNETTLTISSISVGFVRDFFDSYIGTYFERDRGYASLSYLYAGRFLLVVDGGAAPIIYPKIPSLGVTSPFTDIRLDASLFGEYRFKDSFGVNATVRYNENISNTAIVTGGLTDSLSYREIEAYLGVRWLM
jgi:hypothetical protein